MKRIFKKNKWWFLIVLAIGLGLFLFLQKKPEAPKYLTAQATMGDIEESVLATGKINARKTVNVGAQVGGEITKLYVKIGDEVQKGDPIAQIDELTQNNALANAKATLNQAIASRQAAQAALNSRQGDLATHHATIALRQAEYQKAQAHFARMSELIKINAISQQEFEDSRAALAVSEANLTQSQVALAAAKNALVGANAEIVSADTAIARANNDVSTAQKNLGLTRLVAPIAGTVVALASEEGATINANQATPTVATLADLKKMRIKVQISEADVVKLKAGMPAKFSILGRPEQSFDAVLSGIEPAAEASNTSNNAVYYIGYLDIDNPEGLFRINMTAQVNIVIKSIKNVLTVPAAALEQSNGQTSVKVLQSDGSAQSVPVKIGLNNRINAQVLEGLKSGDTVIVGDDTAKIPPKSIDNY